MRSSGLSKPDTTAIVVKPLGGIIGSPHGWEERRAARSDAARRARNCMQQLVRHVAKSACPHDCPSACALEVPVLPGGRIGRITGARDNSYTLGVVCEKVARYAERIEHPDRLLHPMRRKGAKGSGAFEPIGWDAALDEIAENFTRVAQRSGSEAVWPYHSGGNMGILQRY